MKQRNDNPFPVTLMTTTPITEVAPGEVVDLVGDELLSGFSKVATKDIPKDADVPVATPAPQPVEDPAPVEPEDAPEPEASSHPAKAKSHTPPPAE